MKDLAIKILIGVLRAVLAGASAWLVNNGVVNEGQVAQLIAGLATALVTVAWTAYDKIIAARVAHTALATSTGDGNAPTLRDIEHAVKQGVYAVATTSKDVAPVITTPEDRQGV